DPSPARRRASLLPIMPAAPMMRTFMMPPPSSERDAAGRGPGKARDGAGARAIFAADIAGKGTVVDQAKQPTVVHLARVRLAAIGWTGDLIVAGERRELHQGGRHVALRHLAVIEVQLQAKIGFADLVDHGPRRLSRPEKIARLIAPVDRLDQH